MISEYAVSKAAVAAVAVAVAAQPGVERLRVAWEISGDDLVVDLDAAMESLQGQRTAARAGAARALIEGKKSLLLPGVTGVDGDFESGAVIEVVGPEGTIARGICRYASAEIEEVLEARRRGGAAETVPRS